MKTWGQFKRELDGCVPDDTPLVMVHLSVDSRRISTPQLQGLIDGAVRLGDEEFRCVVELSEQERERLRDAPGWPH